EAVTPRAADARDAPAALCSRTQDGVGVVADRNLLRQPAIAHCGENFFLLRRKVDACEQQLRDVCGRRDAVSQTGLAQRAREQLLEHADAAVDTEMVRRALRAADERKRLTVGAHEREVRLGVA